MPAWQDRAIILSQKKYGERHVLLRLFTATRGIAHGLVYGGVGRKKRALLQPGNSIEAAWRGRCPGSLGHFTLELCFSVGVLYFTQPRALAYMQAILATTAMCLHEGTAAPKSFVHLEDLLRALGDEQSWPALLTRYELCLLEEMGYRLALSECAMTGKRNDLAYISPRTGHAVTREVGAPYRDRLFTMPEGLHEGRPPTLAAQKACLAITGWFMEKHLLSWQGKVLPEARRNILT